MKFDQTIRTGARESMQPVDVLRHHQQELPRFLKPNECTMNGIRLSSAKSIPSFKLIVPMFDSRRFRRHEILIINWLTSGPHTLRSAKIGNSAASRNTGAGKNQRPLRSPKIADEIGGRIMNAGGTWCSGHLTSPASFIQAAPNTTGVRCYDT